MKRIAGIIFADTYDSQLGALLHNRALAGVPFGARYRLIDFALSNMVNADVSSVGIIVRDNYQTLMGHVRSGAEWDLDRKRQGLTFLPPFSSVDTERIYENRLTGLIANLEYIRNLTEEFVIVTGCNYVTNVDYSKMLQYHIESGAKVTILYGADAVDNPQEVRVTGMRVADGGKITEILVASQLPKEMKLSLNTYLLSKDTLVEMLEKAVAEDKHSLRRDVIGAMIGKEKVMAYPADGIVIGVDTVQGYMEGSLALLDQTVRRSLFHSANGPIITRVKDSAPAKFGPDAQVSNSIIADGAIVEGTVRNSVIFRGVHICKGAVVENSVIMQDSFISEGAQLGYAILDRKVFIEPGRKLFGYLTHPFLAEKETKI